MGDVHVEIESCRLDFYKRVSNARFMGKKTKKQARLEKRPFTSEKGKNQEKKSEKRKNPEEKKNKQTNKPDQRRGPLHQRRGRTQRKKKKQKTNQKQKKREDQDRSGWLWSVGVGPWVGGLALDQSGSRCGLGRARTWVSTDLDHAQTWVSHRPRSRMGLGRAQTWVALRPGSCVVVRWSGSGVVWLDRVVGSLVLQRILKRFGVLVFSGGLNCWCFISLKIALINRVSKTRFPCGCHM